MIHGSFLVPIAPGGSRLLSALPGPAPAKDQANTDQDEDRGGEQVGPILPDPWITGQQDEAAHDRHDAAGNQRPPQDPGGDQAGQHADQKPAQGEAEQKQAVMVQGRNVPRTLIDQDAQADAAQHTAWNDPADPADQGAPEQQTHADQQDQNTTDIQPVRQQEGGPDPDQEEASRQSAAASIFRLIYG